MLVWRHFVHSSPPDPYTPSHPHPSPSSLFYRWEYLLSGSRHGNTWCRINMFVTTYSVFVTCYADPWPECRGIYVTGFGETLVWQSGRTTAANGIQFLSIVFNMTHTYTHSIMCACTRIHILWRARAHTETIARFIGDSFFNKGLHRLESQTNLMNHPYFVLTAHHAAPIPFQTLLKRTHARAIGSW